MRSEWLPTPATRRSSRTVRVRRRIPPSPISRSARLQGRSRPGPPAAPIASASTTSCCESKRSSARLGASREGARSVFKVVLLRHGESTWNKENRFTGWTDVDLSATGMEEARHAGRLLRESGFAFDVAHTSVLKRAIRTLWIVLDELDQMWIPVHLSWRLNERHYGALQGLNKVETALRYGEEQVLIWRRSYNIRPPALTREDPRYPGFDPRYRNLSPEEIPLTECLED